MGDTIPIGELRYPILICDRKQTPDPAGTGILEGLELVGYRRAKIEDAYPSTNRDSVQLGEPVTNFIWCRWINWPSDTWVIFRLERLSDGSYRKTRYRVRRAKELGGRKRFVEMECEREITAFVTAAEVNEVVPYDFRLTLDPNRADA